MLIKLDQGCPGEVLKLRTFACDRYAGGVFDAGIACAMLFALLIWSAWGISFSKPSAHRESVIFFFILGAAMLLLRWPQIRWQHEIQVDESQMLAQALRFFSHPVPWRDVDGMTGGPLDSMLLSAPMFVGLSASWQTARLMLALLNGMTLLFVYLSLRCFTSRTEARFALLPAVFFYAFATHPDFTHYASETLPAFLIAVCFFLICKGFQEPSTARSYLLGLCAGAIPFAKVQAGPIALLLAGISFTQLLVQRKSNDAGRKAFMGSLLALLLGGATLPILILSVVAACGAFSEFWISYVLASVSYTGQEQFLTKEMNFERVLIGVPDFRFYLYLCAAGMALLPIAWLERKRPTRGTLFWPFLVALLGSVVAMICLLAAGKDYYHYASLLIPGLALVFGLTYLSGKALLTDRSYFGTKISAPIVWTTFFAGMGCTLLIVSASQYATGFAGFNKVQLSLGSNPMSLVARQIRTAGRPGDTMSVWGWMPSYHVETQIPPASRLTVGDGTISKVTRRDYFRTCYMEDLQRSMPTFFVDAIADNTFQWYWINPDSHERFPQLTTFIDNNYELWLSVHATNENTIGSPVRVFVRKDRMLDLHLVPTNLFTPADPCYLFH